MRRKMHRILLLVGLVVALIVTVSCGSTPPASEPADPTEEPAEPAEEPAEPAEEPAEPAEEPAEEAEEPAEEAEEPAEEMSGTTEWSGPMVVGSCCDEPSSLDPAVTIDIPGTQVVTGAYEGLTQYNKDDGAIEPLLAESWEISEDGTLYTFHLREGVVFHDGTEFTADDVKMSFDRVREMNLGVAFFLASVSEVNVVDDMTVEIALTEPDITFWYGVPRIRILSGDAITANEQDGDWAQPFFAENTVGTGPYQLDRWDRGRQIEMVAFEDYWGGWEGKHIERYIVRYSLDQPTKVLLLEQGELHLIEPVGLSDIRRVANNPDIQVNARDVFRGYYHTMNTRNGPLADDRVRRAMLLAFPYDDMLSLMEGYASPMLSPATSNMEGYCDVFEPGQDLEEAARLLAEAGYPDGGFQLRLAYLPGIEQERQSAQLFQEALAELGVDLVLEEIPWGTLLEAQSQPDTAYDFAALYVTSPVPYAGAHLFRLGHSSIQGASYNWAYYENPEFDERVETAQELLPDDPERDQLLCDAQQMMADDVAIIPIMNQQNLDMSRTNLVGYQYDPYGYIHNLHVYDLYIEE